MDILLGTVFNEIEEARIFRRGTPVTVTIMDDLDDSDNENNVKFETEQFANRYYERKKDRRMPWSHEPQVLTELIANGYKPVYPSRIAQALTLSTIPPRAIMNSLTPPQSMESE